MAEELCGCVDQRTESALWQCTQDVSVLSKPLTKVEDVNGGAVCDGVSLSTYILFVIFEIFLRFFFNCEIKSCWENEYLKVNVYSNTDI